MGLINVRNKLYKHLQLRPNDETLREIHKQFKNDLEILIKISKTISEKN